MTLPTIPRVMYDGGNLDVEAVNENLRAISRNIRRNMDLRFSTTSFVFPLDGMTDTDSATGARKINLFGPSVGLAASWQIIGVEVVIYAAAGVTWTMTSTTDTSWPGVSVDTAGVTTEAMDETDKPVAIATPTAFLFTASGTSTITRGYVVFTVLADRGQISNATFTGYIPNLLSSVSSTAGSLLDTEMTNAAAAVTQETNAQTDLRVACFAVRGLASGATSSMLVPSGLRTGSVATAAQTYVCGPVGATVTGRITSATIGTTNTISAGLGVTDLVRNTSTFSAADANAPGTQAQDVTMSLIRGADGGPVCPLCYLLIWWA